MQRTGETFDRRYEAEFVLIELFALLVLLFLLCSGAAPIPVSQTVAPPPGAAQPVASPARPRTAEERLATPAKPRAQLAPESAAADRYQQL